MLLHFKYTMEDGNDLLRSVFFDYGKKNNLSEELLGEVFDILIDSQFIPEGEREHIEAKLRNLLKRYSK